jgi:hypothetical protein
MIATEKGRTYFTVCGSDVDRDGMFLELHISGGKVVAELFYSDQTHEFTFTQLSPEPIPILILQRFIEEAQLDLRQ